MRCALHFSLFWIKFLSGNIKPLNKGLIPSFFQQHLQILPLLSHMYPDALNPLPGNLRKQPPKSKRKRSSKNTPAIVRLYRKRPSRTDPRLREQHLILDQFIRYTAGDLKAQFFQSAPEVFFSIKHGAFFEIFPFDPPGKYVVFVPGPVVFRKVGKPFEDGFRWSVYYYGIFQCRHILQPHFPLVYIIGCDTCFYLTGHLALFDSGLVRVPQWFKIWIFLASLLLLCFRFHHPEDIEIFAFEVINCGFKRVCRGRCSM
ncbi:hypothetical protein MSMTP_2326 [Methanosarcina sp. MTP4]|nr:hypothetical protein MSMTP_2326 [Methanosarcina sp. MTP4]